MNGRLMSLELEILRGISTDGPVRPRAYVAWQDANGEVQMGPCRYRHTGDHYSVSPFPGAWTMVHISQILRVHHLQAMSLGPVPSFNQPCSVCQK